MVLVQPSGCSNPAQALSPHSHCDRVGFGTRGHFVLLRVSGYTAVMRHTQHQPGRAVSIVSPGAIAPQAQLQRKPRPQGQFLMKLGTTR